MKWEIKRWLKHLRKIQVMEERTPFLPQPNWTLDTCSNSFLPWGEARSRGFPLHWAGPDHHLILSFPEPGTLSCQHLASGKTETPSGRLPPEVWTVGYVSFSFFSFFLSQKEAKSWEFSPDPAWQSECHKFSYWFGCWLVSLPPWGASAS